MQEMVWALKKTQHKSFEGSNKPGKFLAYILKRKRQNGLVNSITVEGREVTDKNWIKAAFLKFYTKLYHKSHTELEKIQNYILKCYVRKLKEEKNQLEEPITIEEIEEAITQMISGKASGSDGFTEKFYKVFTSELAQWFQRVMNDILEGKKVPQTWQKATISLILKQEGSCIDVKNFRPISC